ncbi:MAG: HlyC/CorC family transporter [Gracilimonas sp.]|uniref:Hemolysin family protein n=1 Tax=Gracilimonas sediminicola TaxID=2952158 RepID=A0A9X2L279_9BACT|nr:MULTISPECIES: hemolysin family protein [Gracilimonas]MBO6584548.1 HlyC/CorC family transporter [Gracilimonas sp.]MBO6616181.1 HlyC/CorC family transporter [Gracilimonas sp.]MCP9290991.1 hemolysin family protein [Gracilimonas sediminicola]
MGLLIFYLILAIGVSFLCSILEAVLLSITPSFVAVLEREDAKSGKILRDLKQDIDRPLSAILSLNTIAHTVGAAGVGAQAQVVFGNAYVSITSAILTLLILVFSEIIPKTLGATYWKKLSGFAARVTNVLIYITYPLVLLSQGITKILSSEEKQPTVSREEFSAMADVGFEEGVFEEGESNIFKNLIRFRSLRVKDIMTPRIVVVKFQEDQTIKEILDKKDELRVSRMPVFGEDDEDITGYVLKNDLYYNLSEENGDKKLKEIKREVLIVPETISLKTLFERLLEKQEHIAVVVDEYGGLSGVVTMEDVVETLLGMEIVDEIDAIEDMQKLARQKWRERAKRLGIVLPEKLKQQSEKA